jgi:predicted O-linked N-acetylglucosamine transferase (SPINDLY family)
MVAPPLSNTNVSWQEQAYQYFIGGEYQRAAIIWEEATTAEPVVKTHWWYLGLALLLQEKEEEAQAAWFMAMADGEPEEIEEWVKELARVLEVEAERRESLADLKVAKLIRQHLREIAPEQINNLLHLIQLEIRSGTLSADDVEEFRIIELLNSDISAEIDEELLLRILRQLFDFALLDPFSHEFAAACIPHIRKPEEFIKLFGLTANKIACENRVPTLAVDLLELNLRLEPKNATTLIHLSSYCQSAKQYDRAIEIGRLACSLDASIAGKIIARRVLLRGLLMTGGRWEEACSVFEELQSLLNSFIEEPPPSLSINKGSILYLVNSTFFHPYFQDNPQQNRYIQNQLLKFCTEQIQAHLEENFHRYSQRHGPHRNKKLKIGYLSHCLREHSVGWLTRGLIHHQDRSRFQTHAYFINYIHVIEDPLQNWYVSNVDKAYKGGRSAIEIAEQIYNDEIDILIELDSLTLDVSNEILALKPAPIQATWLGWDASGLTTIDYFIADPYVLPENAQEYYTEKIWRLPRTYIAVDGFEVGIPTLRRDLLDIPSDAVIYYSGQKGYKRHYDTARLQMRIIKEVPNSYFLIKGSDDNIADVETFFTRIAEEEEVDPSRLRFLKNAPSEAVHRANLAIADIVLDTYPYNGATTTLETLWMGIPLVTRVGQQFAARNSYGMMINAGINEGIAWTDEEYLEWGVRLGKDQILRQQIAWKLKQSRQTSPLWNAKQFAREMEKAYEQMWAIHLENSKF